MAIHSLKIYSARSVAVMSHHRLGTKAHSTTSRPIIASNLLRYSATLDDDKQSNETYNGCKLHKPTLPAKAPVIKGTMAPPIVPNPAIHPMDPVKSHGGKMREAWFIAIG